MCVVGGPPAGGAPRALFVYICMVQTEPTGEKSRRKPKM